MKFFGTNKCMLPITTLWKGVYVYIYEILIEFEFMNVCSHILWYFSKWQKYKMKIKLVYIGGPAYYGDQWVNIC